MFDDALRPTGIRATQLGLLLAMRGAGTQTITALAELLVMDRTTLSRNLKPLENQGLVRIECGEDRRVRTVATTPAGCRAVERALPLWAAVQERIVTGVGEDRYARLISDLSETVAVTRDAGDRAGSKPH